VTGADTNSAVHRRTFLGCLAALAVAAPATELLAQRKPGGRFGLDYAPHFGMFQHSAGEDLFDQLQFMHDEGFRALEDNNLPTRDLAVQERLGRELSRLGIRMGVFVAHTAWGEISFASDAPEVRNRILGDIRTAVEVAQRVDAKWCTVVPGEYDRNLAWDYQTANVVDNLKRAAEICEPVGVTMVLEPLNQLTDHPGVFLTGVPQAYQICKAVGSPSCKILDDLYHQQITEGNLIPNLDRAWGEIAYIQVGDNPGRNEPTTGEIHYRNIFRHLKRKGYQGVVGMEHGNSIEGREGERRVIRAYVEVDQ